MSSKQASSEKALEKAPGTAITVVDFEGDEGAGMENVDRSEWTIPFVRIVQAGSPQAKPKAVGGLGPVVVRVHHDQPGRRQHQGRDVPADHVVVERGLRVHQVRRRLLAGDRDVDDVGATYPANESQARARATSRDVMPPASWVVSSTTTVP